MIIYKITNKLNGKLYIGQTVQDLHDRWSDHSRPSKGKHVNRSAIAQAIRKYGKENFTIEKIDFAGTLESLNLLEIHYILKYNSLAPNGYNLEVGGDSKMCHPETKLKISKTLKGRPIKNRMNGAPKGRPVSAERREAISRTMLGKAQPWNYKPIQVIETGTIYDSVNTASSVLNIHRGVISGLLKTGRRHKKTGLTFRLYANITNKESKNG